MSNVKALIVACVSVFVSTASYSQILFTRQVTYCTSSLLKANPFTVSIPLGSDSTIFIVESNSTQSLIRNEIIEAKGDFSNIIAYKDLGEFSFSDLDSNYVLIKKAGCDDVKKIKFQVWSSPKKIKDTTILNLPVTVFYHQTLYDSLYLYITSALPKSAGVLLINNIHGCIIGHRSKSMQTLPIKLENKPSNFILPNLLVDMQPYKSSQNMDSEIKHLIVDKNFPKFAATTLNGQLVNQNSLLSKATSIIIILNKLVSCTKPLLQFKKVIDNEREQDIELLDAVERLRLKYNIGAYVISEDYAEEVDKYEYKNLEIITNASAWKNKLGITYSPQIIILNGDTITHLLSAFDFTREDFYPALERIIKKNLTIRN